MSGDDVESDLIRRCLAGEEAAWERLFDQHHAPLVRFAFAFSDRVSVEDAQEIAQETLLAAVRSLPTFRGGCAIQSWLFRIAINKARDHLERSAAQRRGGGRAPLPIRGGSLPGPDGVERGVDPADPSGRPDDLAAADDDAGAVRAAIDRLGPPCDELIRLRFYGGLEYAEIAAVSGLNVKTVSSRLSRCVEKLGSLLKPLLSGARTPSIPSNT